MKTLFPMAGTECDRAVCSTALRNRTTSFSHIGIQPTAFRRFILHEPGPFIYERPLGGPKFTDILIDYEFQDTSILQMAQSYCHWGKFSFPADYINLIVGDGKQVIYRMAKWGDGRQFARTAGHTGK